MSAPPLRAIGELVEPVSSWTPERDGPDGVFTYIDLSAVDQDAKAIAGAREVVCSEAPSRARQLVRAGDVLVSTVRPNLNGVAHVPPEFDGATASTGFCVLRPRATQLDGQYLYQWVKSPHFVKDMVRKATGASYPAVSDRIVCESKIPLPPIPEQRRIAEILDKADALRAKRRAALAQLDTLTQSIFLDMFGDPISNPRGWPTVRFEQLCERVTVGVVVQPASYYVSEGVPALRSLNIRPGKIVLDDLVYFSKSDNDTKLAKTKLRAGDVVLVRSGQPGTAAVVPPELDGVNAIDILIATPDQQLTNPTFLCEFFNSAGGRDLVLSRQRGQVQKHLNVGSLNQAILPLPSIDLQCEFAARVAAVERHREAELASSTALDALFASLQHRAFRGEL
ncbi:MAG: restriction endonuclease subunit S [Thermaerobacter sp.]|nr:restriction endonuclease subunit S [Thermaerobacter sp.]